MTKDPVVTLKVAGQLHRGWKKVEITRSIETIAGGFSLTISDWDPARRKIVTVAPGMACEVDVDGETVITGYVDETSVAFDAEKHEVTVTGRDRAGDLVDCAAYVPEMIVAIWNAPKTALDVVTAIAKPFGIKAKAEANAELLKLQLPFSLQPGETAFAAIDRLARDNAFLPISDGLGNLVLTLGGMGGPFAALKEGVNMLAANGGANWRERYSRYWVFANEAKPLINPDAAPVKGIANDPAVQRWRPKVILSDAETAPTAATPDPWTPRAQWEASVAAARAYRHTITVQGWRDDGGKLWQPNGLVPVTSSMLGIGKETLIIAEVKWLIDEEGSRTELSVTRPDAFKRIPLIDIADYSQSQQTGTGAP